MQPSIQEFWSGLPTPGRVAVTAVPSLVIAAIITAVRCGASRELRHTYDHISDTARSSTSREVAPNARLCSTHFDALKASGSDPGQIQRRFWKHFSLWRASVRVKWRHAVAP